jgi:hypothetical protein
MKRTKVDIIEHFEEAKAVLSVVMQPADRVDCGGSTATDWLDWFR